jgi:hypothetical protein
VRDDDPSAEDATRLGYATSRWVALSPRPDQLAAQVAEVGGEWRQVVPGDDAQSWTDDHASVLPLLR